VPSHEGTAGASPAPWKGEGPLGQDHLYESSEKKTSTGPVPQGDLGIRQENAGRPTLPDGTVLSADSKLDRQGGDRDILSERPVEHKKEPLAEFHTERDGLEPSSSATSTIPTPAAASSEHARLLQREYEHQIPSKPADSDGHSLNKLSSGHDEDSVYEPSKHSSPVLSSLPRFKIPKQTGDTQGTDRHVEDIGINSDSYSSPVASSSILETAAITEQEEVPEGVNTDLFYSPRVSKMLGGKKLPAKSYLELKGIVGKPVERTKPTEKKDQDTFNVRLLSQTEPTSSTLPLKAPEPTQPVTTDEDLQSLAQDIANDAADEKPTVSSPATTNIWLSC